MSYILRLAEIDYFFGDVGRMVGDAFEALRDHHEVEAAG